jgi:SAM-dependent methyltransferase
MLAEHKHQTGIRLYAEGHFEDASRILREALVEDVTSEIANDWAAAELACGHAEVAEQGFTQALRLDARNVEAAANLSALLAGLGRIDEAIAVLEQANRGAEAAQKGTLMPLLAECRNRAASRVLGEAHETLRRTFADLNGVCALPKTLGEPVLPAGAPSRVRARPTDGCMVYKPDFLHVPVQVAELSGEHWESKKDHAVGSGVGAALRWQTVGSRIYVLLTHFPWGGKIAVTVNGRLCDVVDLYSHAKYVEPFEVFFSSVTSPVSVELRVDGQNRLARSDQLACFGFLTAKETFSEARRIETEAGFLAIQKQQVVNWLESIKRRGLTLEEVTEQRKRAYTLRVFEAMAFVPSGHRVLDLGCGYVFREILQNIILPRGIDYWLQDIDPEVCNANRSLFVEHQLDTNHISCGDNTSLPYPNRHFDCVFSSHCLEHSKDLSRTFSGLSRIIKPGGVLIFAVPRNWDRAEEHVYAPLQDGWETFAQRHDFHVISSNLGCYYGEGGEYDLLVVAVRN